MQTAIWESRALLWQTILRLSASVFLLHALVTGPLFIQCIPSDGRSLTELVGCDPCRHPLQGVHGYPRGPEGWTPGEQESPCVDLMIDNPGITMSGAVITSGAASRACVSAMSAETTVLCGPFAFTTRELARAPGILSSPIGSARFSLRI